MHWFFFSVFSRSGTKKSLLWYSKILIMCTIQNHIDLKITDIKNETTSIVKYNFFIVLLVHAKNVGRPPIRWYSIPLSLPDIPGHDLPLLYLHSRNRGTERVLAIHVHFDEHFHFITNIIIPLCPRHQSPWFERQHYSLAVWLQAYYSVAASSFCVLIHHFKAEAIFCLHVHVTIL